MGNIFKHGRGPAKAGSGRPKNWSAAFASHSSRRIGGNAKPSAQARLARAVSKALPKSDSAVQGGRRDRAGQALRAQNLPRVAAIVGAHNTRNSTAVAGGNRDRVARAIRDVRNEYRKKGVGLKTTGQISNSGGAGGGLHGKRTASRGSGAWDESAHPRDSSGEWRDK